MPFSSGCLSLDGATGPGSLLCEADKRVKHLEGLAGRCSAQECQEEIEGLLELDGGSAEGQQATSLVNITSLGAVQLPLAG